MIKMTGFIIIGLSFLLALVLFTESMAISKLMEWISDDEVLGLFAAIVFMNILLKDFYVYKKEC